MMQKVRVICAVSLFLLSYHYQLQHLAFAGPQEINLNELSPKLSKEKSLTSQDVDYITSSINNKELLSVIDKWQVENESILSADAKIEILSDYLLAERRYLSRNRTESEVRSAGLFALPSYLDQIRTKDEIMGIGIHLGSALNIRFMAYPSKNKYGRLKVDSIPDKAEIYIDEKFIDNSDKTFILAIGEHSLKVKKSDYKDIMRDITIESGKQLSIKCELLKQ